MISEVEKEIWGKQIVKIDGKYIPYYRHLMQEKLGRKLLRGELVHHINLNHFDNRIENLQLVSHKEHMQIHGKLKNKNSKCFTVSIDEEVLKEFKKACDDTAINRSAYISSKMKEFVEEFKAKEIKISESSITM